MMCTVTQLAGSSSFGSTRPEAPLSAPFVPPGEIPRGAKAIYQTVSGETVWNVAGRVGLHNFRWRQAPKRCSFAPFRRLVGPRNGADSEFPDSFGRGILESWTSA